MHPLVSKLSGLMRGRRLLRWTALAAVVVTGLLSSGAATASAASAQSNQVLSNEFTFTSWAYVARAARVYSEPSVWSHVVGHLTWYTEDGFPSIYLLLRASQDSRGREWVELRIPGRPNGRTGWVLRSALGSFHLTHQLVIVDRAALRMYFYDNGVRIWSAPVGIGAASTPTPPGRFWINERFALPASNPYYPYAFGTTDYSTLTDWPGGGVVGIHGPYGASWSQIPGRISHGCIRLHVPDDFWLARHIQLGDPVWVR
jgi:L,D-transpeptidase catalytic domain